MSGRRTLRVLLEGDRWVVIFDESLAPISTHRMKRDAIQVARSLMLREAADLVIHKATPGYVMDLDDTL